MSPRGIPISGHEGAPGRTVDDRARSFTRDERFPLVTGSDQECPSREFDPRLDA